MDFEGRDRLSAYKTSILDDIQSWIRSVVPFMKRPLFALPGPPESPLEPWLRAMDFTHVQSLEISEDDHFCERMGRELPRLRDLTLHGYANLTAAARAFLQEMPPLEALALRARVPSRYDGCVRRAPFPLDALLARHGPSLRTLRLHQAETDDPTQRRLALRPSQIRSIGRACPHLTHLGLDVDRNESWPNATLAALATGLPQVQALDLNFEIGADLNQGADGRYYRNPDGIERGGRFREPRLSKDVAEVLFADLRRHKEGVELRWLNVTVGDFDQRPYHGPLYLPAWGEGRARRFVCDSTGSKGDGRPPFCRKSFDLRDPFGLGYGNLYGMNYTSSDKMDELLELK